METLCPILDLLLNTDNNMRDENLTTTLLKSIF